MCKGNRKPARETDFGVGKPATETHAVYEFPVC